MQPAQADLIVRGRIATMDATRRVIDDGALAVVGGRIAALGPHAEIVRDWTAPRSLGDARSIVLPGFIDAHTHCSQCFVRSLTTGELPMIPRIYNPAQRSLDATQAGQTVRLIAAQLLRSGITTLCEGTLNPAHEEAIVGAIEEVGIRCNLARGCADQDFHHAALYAQVRDRSWLKAREGEAEIDLARSAAFLDRYPARGDRLIRGAVNASALLGFSERYFRDGHALARERGATLQVHVGRDREEVEFCLAVFGRRPVERLADLGVIDRHLVAVHAVLASETEIELLARGGASLAHSPVECVANLNAIPNLPRFRAAGIRVALGCDNQANDIFVTMRAAWLIHGAKWGVGAYDPEFLAPGDIIAMATSEAADVLFMDDLVGSLEVGKAADIALLDGSGPHLMAMQHLSSEILRYASRAEVKATIVAGRVLYEDGAFATIDVERLRADADAGAAHVRGVLADRRYRALPHF
ncbi:amidohydrolase family protein [Prosthecomicrobium sp. N25]|uniref:amidohydrolase family protein n=1 Tax=Prosthecomicrobium sp. N25 TaxID=3129254 RepID=UPI0030783226